MNPSTDPYTIAASIVTILLFISEALGWSNCDSNSISQFCLKTSNFRQPKKEEEEEEEVVVGSTEEQALVDLLVDINKQ